MYFSLVLSPLYKPGHPVNKSGSPAYIPVVPIAWLNNTFIESPGQLLIVLRPAPGKALYGT